MATCQNDTHSRRTGARAIGKVPSQDYEVSEAFPTVFAHPTLTLASLWRPLFSTVENFPLAILDPRSVDWENDTIALDQVTPAQTAESSYLMANPNHRWYWKSRMTPDDAILFTQYDTHPPGEEMNLMYT